MDSNELKNISSKVSFEEWFACDETEGNITYYFICDDMEFTRKFFKDDDYEEEILGFTVSVEVSLPLMDNEYPSIEISPFVKDCNGYADIDWRDIVLPDDEAYELAAIGAKHYKADMERRSRV